MVAAKTSSLTNPKILGLLLICLAAAGLGYGQVSSLLPGQKPAATVSSPDGYWFCAGRAVRK
jgi:hypothetical protein